MHIIYRLYMKIFIKFYLLTIRKDLSCFALISFIIFFSINIYLKKESIQSDFVITFLDFLQGLSTAYIASFIFYLVDIHYKRQKEKQILYKYIGKLFKQIIDDGKSIYTDMASHIGKSISFDLMTKDDIIEMCSLTDPLSKSKVKYWNENTELNWLEYLEYKKERLQEFSSKIQMQIHLTDIEFIEIITKYNDLSLFSCLDWMLKIYRKNKLRNNSFLYGMEINFIKHAELIKLSELYYKKEFAYYIE